MNHDIKEVNAKGVLKYFIMYRVFVCVWGTFYDQFV